MDALGHRGPTLAIEAGAGFAPADRSSKHAIDEKPNAYQLDRDRKGDRGFQERRKKLHEGASSRRRARTLIAEMLSLSSRAVMRIARTVQETIPTA